MDRAAQRDLLGRLRRAVGIVTRDSHRSSDRLPNIHKATKRVPEPRSMQFREGAIVRTPGGPCMSVIAQAADGRVTCGWLEDGEVQVARLPPEVLEGVSANKEKAAWVQAVKQREEVHAYIRRRHG
jgi:uncharacterized protein YodC (DUF2158 family)